MRDLLAIHRGFEAFLRADSALMALAPGGLWMKAPQAVTGVRLIWRVQSTTFEPTHDDGGVDRVVYSLMAVDQSPTASAAAAAAARTVALLRPQNGVQASFPVDGYTVISCDLHQDNPNVCETELDGDLRWQFRGYLWDITAAPA